MVNLLLVPVRFNLLTLTGEGALAREVFGDLGGGLASDEGREFCHTRPRDACDRAEISQQAVLAFFADAGDGGQL